MPVVVVESPAKAKTINNYLGDDYTVLASYGHVRDLPAKDGSVDPEQGFEMTWEVAPDSRKHLRAIAAALKDDPELILATDPDREGEAISWHLTEALATSRALKRDTPVRRVVFNAITKAAVTEAMRNPRDVDMELVRAYLARRALDYLVGFTLSPVLWRKLPGARSAGRVQSVCLRLIVEREMEIEAFRAREYWTVAARLTTPRGQSLEARLVRFAGRRLDRFDLATAVDAEMAVQAVAARALFVENVEAKPATRNPAPPFMTSTLQQEASRKFGMGARQCMNAAQRLYEAGHITYMRTDGIDMAPEAVRAVRDEIARRYGAEFLPDSPRNYRNKAKNAQEAHECIRPTEMSLDPGRLRLTDSDQKRLYELIWKRTLACQMAAARLERTTVEIASPDGQVGLRATGQVIQFEGFLKVYEEGRDDEAEDGEETRLPQMAAGEELRRAAGAYAGDSRQGETRMSEDGAVIAAQSFTQPPPRYTEATLVKRMEELGIGRPSTYASIVTTIQERGYVRKDRNRLHPEDKGRLVTAFLENYFRRYVGYDFTAALEDELDEISGGRQDWKAVLERFWQDFSAAVAETSELRITDVLAKINDVLAPHLFPDRGDGSDPRLCPSCGEGRLSLRTARAGGAFIGCSNYPACRYTRSFGQGGDEAGTLPPEGRLLGHDEAGQPISLRGGRFGPYVQRGEAGAEGEKPPRASLPKGVGPDDVDLALALRLLSLPRVVGPHPEDGEPVEAGIGRYGPYVRHGRIYANLTDPEDVFTVGMNRAVELLAAKRSGGRGRAAAEPLRVLGEHPDGGQVAVMNGRYGPYVKWEKVNATLPRETAPEAVTLEQALELVAEKAARKPGRGKAGGRASASAAGATKTGTAKSAKPKAAKAKTSKAKTGATKTAKAKTGAAKAGTAPAAGGKGTRKASG